MRALGTFDPKVITEGTLAYGLVFPSGFKAVLIGSAGPITPGVRALAEKERAGDAEADRLDLVAHGGPDLLNGVGDHLHEAVLIEAVDQTIGTVMDREVGVDRAGQELGAAEVDAYDASLDHAGHHTALPMADDEERAQYTRTDPVPVRRGEGLRGLRRAASREPVRGTADRSRSALRRPGGRPPVHGRPRRRATSRSRSAPGCCSRWSCSWSARRSSPAKVSDAAEAKLSGGGYPLTSPEHDPRARVRRAREGQGRAGRADDRRSPSRSDSILLLRIGGGANAQLSILRDTVVDIPGHGRNKINAAYAFGGPSLAIETVEQYLGIDINHLVEVNFENFPDLIDSLGGITYTGNCVISKINGGSRNGGTTLRLKAGTHELNGDQALALARTRHNDCRPQEDDRARVRRQQKILTAIKGKVTSFETFIRLPWVAWAAPKAMRSDMSGPTLLGLVGAELIGGNAQEEVLKPSGAETLPDGGAGLTVDDADKQRAVDEFLKG